MSLIDSEEIGVGGAGLPGSKESEPKIEKKNTSLKRTGTINKAK